MYNGLWKSKCFLKTFLQPLLNGHTKFLTQIISGIYVTVLNIQEEIQLNLKPEGKLGVFCILQRGKIRLVFGERGQFDEHFQIFHIYKRQFFGM